MVKFQYDNLKYSMYDQGDYKLHNFFHIISFCHSMKQSKTITIMILSKIHSDIQFPIVVILKYLNIYKVLLKNLVVGKGLRQLALFQNYKHTFTISYSHYSCLHTFILAELKQYSYLFKLEIYKLFHYFVLISLFVR